MLEMTVNLSDLSGAATQYVAPPVTCRLTDVISALNLALTTGDSTITLSDGTTTIGTVTITQSGSAAGDIDRLVVDSTSLGKVELGPNTPLKITNDATPGQGATNLTLKFDEYHAG